MIYGIDSFTILQDNESVTFVRCGEHLGWYTFVAGERYGAWIRVVAADVVEGLEILCDQAAATIAHKTGQGSQFERELALGLREQAKQAAK